MLKPTTLSDVLIMSLVLDDCALPLISG